MMTDQAQLRQEIYDNRQQAAKFYRQYFSFDDEKIMPLVRQMFELEIQDPDNPALPDLQAQVSTLDTEAEPLLTQARLYAQKAQTAQDQLDRLIFD